MDPITIVIPRVVPFEIEGPSPPVQRKRNSEPRDQIHSVCLPSERQTWPDPLERRSVATNIADIVQSVSYQSAIISLLQCVGTL